jgi:hypothetical protein
MRQGQNRRMRGRSNNNSNRKGPNTLSRSFESNGPDVKVRGTPQHIAEKYVQLARDAQSSGDPVMAESYFQHAEHYYRIVLAAQMEANPNQFQSQRPFGDDNEDGDEEGEEDGVQDAAEPGHQGFMPRDDEQPFMGGRETNPPRDPYSRDNQNRDNQNRGEGNRNNNRFDRNNRFGGQDRGGQDRPREDRPRDDRPRDERPRQDRNFQDRSREDRPQQDRPQGDRPQQDRGFNGNQRNRDQRPRDFAPRDSGPRDYSQQDQPGRDQGPRDQGPREYAPRDNPPRDRMSRENDPAPVVESKAPRAPAPVDDVAPGLPAFVTAPRRVIVDSPANDAGMDAPPAAVAGEEAPRRRGRPPGSRNKVKVEDSAD